VVRDYFAARERTEIVAYCRGPYCVLAPQAVERLRARGYKARRLADGLPECACRSCRSPWEQ
jgi:rhodanese-related sulfurtransferase